MRTVILLILSLAFCQSVSSRPASVTLVKDGKARCAIFVPPATMASDNKDILDINSGAEFDAEVARIRLRESVNDLARCLGKMSGAKVPIFTRKPTANDRVITLLVDAYAQEVFGDPKELSPYRQGWRMVVTKKAVGFIGQTPEATSYAIYELLDRLGCRWYMPSDIGEVIPSRKTISLPKEDTSAFPHVIARRIWYADDDYMRRNRLGGLYLDAGHALEIRGYVSQEQLEAHPDWNAEIGGKRSVNGRFCWASKEVAEAVADGIIAQLDKQYVDTISLSPDDGATFCECDKCKALDAGDWDSSMNCVSATDRFIYFINQIAERVNKKYPDVLFGVYAYVQYTRPPVREKLNSNIVPVLAPITYCRPHAMTDATCPSRSQLTKFVEGWGKSSKHFGLYEYAFNLAEVIAPNPMITKWSTELPIFYKNNMDLWMPETMPNFETVLPGLYLGIRMSWDPTRSPKAILDEFYPNFYGSAAKPMRRYWELIDSTWTNTPEHGGGGYGYGRFFPDKVMKEARELLNEALKDSKTIMEYRRVKIVDDSFAVFEGYMNLRNRFYNGDYLASSTNSKSATSSNWPIDEEYNLWYGYSTGKSLDYKEQYSFAPRGYDWFSVGTHYVDGYWGESYRNAARVATDFNQLGTVNNTWRYQADAEKKGEQEGWQAPTFDDSAWKTMDVSMDTLSDLGLPDYYGSIWYRATMNVPAIPEGKKVYLWVSNFDMICKLYVNGQLVPYVDAAGVETPDCTAYCTPVSFNVTSAIKPEADNLITLIVTRPSLNELGAGGLQGPVMLYREKD